MDDYGHETMDDDLIARAAAALRRPIPLDDRFGDRFDERVMARVLAGTANAGRGAPSGGRSLWRWLADPRTLRLSPLAGLASAAALVAVAALAGMRAAVARQAASPVAAGYARAASPGDSTVVTQFMLVAPGAHSVSLVGDFNDWRVGAVPMRATAAGRVWTITVPLGAGRHRYAFVVDGQRWTPDPAAPTDGRDDFGSPSSVVTVVEHRT